MKANTTDSHPWGRIALIPAVAAMIFGACGTDEGSTASTGNASTSASTTGDNDSGSDSATSPSSGAEGEGSTSGAASGSGPSSGAEGGSSSSGSEGGSSTGGECAPAANGCVDCEDVVNDGCDPELLCPEEGELFGALFNCVCVEFCDAECGDNVCNGDEATPECEACFGQSCDAELTACVMGG